VFCDLVGSTVLASRLAIYHCQRCLNGRS
jgi:hypothetical protein